MANPWKFGSLLFTLVICSGFVTAADSPGSSVMLGKLPAGFAVPLNVEIKAGGTWAECE
jgi:hypothetical protein